MSRLSTRRNKMSTYDLPIDLVYLYVNSSDEAWIAKRNQYAMDQNNSVCRFRDNKELMYSLRSVEKYAPWIRNIYIVSNSSMPAWLNTDHPKLHVVGHEIILPTDSLPCFNSSVIECYLHRIPGLSEIFLYANDDMFFGNHVSPDFFVKDSKPIVRMVKNDIAPTNNYKRIILNSKKTLFDHYRKEYALVPWHNIDVYTKTGIDACAKEFRKELEACSHNHIRKDNDIHRVLFQYYLIFTEACLLVTHDQSSHIKRLFDYGRMLFFPAKYLDGFNSTTHDLFKSPQFKQLLFKGPRYVCRELIRSPLYKKLFFKHPFCACINDSEDTTEVDLKEYKELMEKLFPEKSSFEK